VLQLLHEHEHGRSVTQGQTAGHLTGRGTHASEITYGEGAVEAGANDGVRSTMTNEHMFALARAGSRC
jgi:hypothetical protein